MESTIIYKYFFVLSLQIKNLRFILKDLICFKGISFLWIPKNFMKFQTIITNEYFSLQFYFNFEGCQPKYKKETREMSIVLFDGGTELSK